MSLLGSKSGWRNRKPLYASHIQAQLGLRFVEMDPVMDMNVPVQVYAVRKRAVWT
jgi:hypothetical protein